MKLVGYSRSSGVYEGHAYDNVILMLEYTSKHTEGIAVKTQKVKATIFEKSGVEIGDNVSFYFDGFKNVVHMYKD